MKAIGSTDKFSRAILAHLFCPHCALDPPHSSGYASGLPPQSARKIYANLRVYFISDSLENPKNSPASKSMQGSFMCEIHICIFVSIEQRKYKRYNGHRNFRLYGRGAV